MLPVNAKGEYFVTIGERLKEERKRLGYNQTDFAALYGVSKKSQIEYEKDAFSPTAKQLAALVPYGVDILYVVTGRKDEFTKDELELVGLFRSVTLEEKILIVQKVKERI